MSAHHPLCPAQHLPRPDYPCVCQQVEEVLGKPQPHERSWPYVALWSFVGLYLAAGAYALAALLGWVPAAPWSPVGQL